MSTEEVATTGHVIGATYRSSYWGGEYKVIGNAETTFGPGVEVECVEPGAGAHQTIGERWTHSTQLDPKDERVDQPFNQAEFDAFRSDPRRIALVRRILAD